MGFRFEELDVYKESLEFANEIYDMTKRYPKTEIFGTINQIRRAAMSVSQNIAEGSGRTKKEFRHFLDMARTSLYECIPLLEISKMQGYINTGEFSKLYERCNILAKRLNALKNSIREL
jgi:four helix bundle protein